MSYEIEEVFGIVEGEDELRELKGVNVMCGKSRAAGFQGGLTATIVVTAKASPTESIRQAFLHGLVLAMAHCAITGAIPTVVDA